MRRAFAIVLKRCRNGLVVFSSSESDHPSPVVSPMPSRRSFPSRCRRLRPSEYLFSAVTLEAERAGEETERTMVEAGEMMPARSMRWLSRAERDEH